MGRARRPATLLVVALGAAWLVCFALHLTQLARGGLAWLPLYVDPAASAAAFPTLRALWPGAESHAPGLAPGDELHALGGASLAGASRLDVVRAFYAQPPRAPIALEAARAGQPIATRVTLLPVPDGWRMALASAAFALLGTLGWWRTRSRAGLVFYLGMMTYAFHQAAFWGGGALRTSAAIAVFGAATALNSPLALRLPLVFPEESARRGRWSALWPWLFLPSGLIFTIWAFGLPFPLAGAGQLALALNAAFVGALVFAIAKSYRRCGPRGRRQLKWVLLGFWVGLVPVLLASLAAVAAPELWWLYQASLVLTLALPASLFVALTRFNLLDVDRLLTGAATYTLLGVAALAGAGLLASAASSAVAAWVEPGVSQPLLSVALAGAVVLGLRRVDTRVQAWLRPERAALEREAQRVRRDLGECEKPTDVLLVMGRELQSLLRLETVAVYVRALDAFAPVVAHGAGISPAFAFDGALASRLADRDLALDLSREGFERFAREAAAPGAREDWEALAAMGVELVIPLRLRGELAAFACLGGKRSGDVFTRAEVALLEAVAEKAADELARFDREDVARQSRLLMDELRRFVPRAVARELDAGEKLDPGEREVSVLFVDIRGYTPFAAGQRPRAIFEAVSRYTELVSKVVEDCHGSVVEFHGDGLMAVFGAPRALEQKERWAVRAARQIAAGVPRLELRDADGRPRRLEVGVGIATGPAYTGPLRAVDRAIWVALGNTTNLAARLESATRELGVSVVIDAQTQARAGDEAAGFAPRRGVRVKGRSESFDVYTFGSASAAAAPAQEAAR